MIVGPVPQPRAADSFAQLIRQHQSAVWGYLRVLGADSATAGDLTQETFLRVHPAAGSASGRSWISRRRHSGPLGRTRPWCR